MTRIHVQDDRSVAICLLDTGVNAGHLLLEPIVNPDDLHAYIADWGTDDRDGHGTTMAGLALFGDLFPLLQSREAVFVQHSLESVNIFPRAGKTDPQHFAAITAGSVSKPEILFPNRQRIFVLATTATDERDRGQPTSWSASIDALAFGRQVASNGRDLTFLDDDNSESLIPRLFIISAGNLDHTRPAVNYLDRSDLESVHDPAQAWNALTVGAFTSKTAILDPYFDSLVPIAGSGDLSPCSTTSVAFESAWPIKPDIVLEGGNIATDGSGLVEDKCPDLNLLSTSSDLTKNLFTLTGQTSAASAEAGRIAAHIQLNYPNFWPETIRGLMVHSSRWTSAMHSHLPSKSTKSDRLTLTRRYGHGVPSMDRALSSASNRLNLITQENIHPFSKGKLREMHTHRLPWPREALELIAEHNGVLRITLSYFVEPNAKRRGWTGRYSYPSHQLRFSVINPQESLRDFRQRVNLSARAEEIGKNSSTSDTMADEWFLGSNARHRGSVHSDFMTITAAQLSTSNVIAVYPVTGWWQGQTSVDRSDRGVRYSLIASVEIAENLVDLWSPVAAIVTPPIQLDLAL